VEEENLNHGVDGLSGSFQSVPHIWIIKYLKLIGVCNKKICLAEKLCVIGKNYAHVYRKEDNISTRHRNKYVLF
jgi:hypothetical protein